MRKSIICFVCLALFMVSATQIHAQNLKGLFDKEEAVFYVSVTPAPDSGVAMVTLYFTHSKAPAIEASLWIKDLGTNLATVSSTRLVKDLWEMSNRKQDTIYIEGLANLHFYTIGLDYRTPKSLSSRFASKVLSDSYRYEYPGKKATAYNKKATPTDNMNAPRPCETPDLMVRSEADGYCGADNRPAVVIECVNCKGQTWSFNVDYSSNGAGWKPLRSDGKPQSATGNATRTEPLCILPDGEYNIRVSATGENCTTPVYHYLGGTLRIGAPKIATTIVTTILVEEPIMDKAAPMTIPDTCTAFAQATLYDEVIRGAVTLSAGSPCEGSRPYAQIRYVHPGHRDQTVEQAPLIAGKAIPFRFNLDEADLKRSIHTIQVVIYISPGTGSSPIPLSTFWIRAAIGQGELAMGNDQVQSKGLPDPGNLPTESKPKNYNRLQDLRPVYLSVQSDIPAYIAWTNPAECINGGCAYTVWAGKSNGPIRLLAKGKQGGSLVKESLQSLTVEERYIEVEVETKSGSSIAAYVFGQGPGYNFGENYLHRERLAPTISKPEPTFENKLVEQPAPTPIEQMVAKGKVQNSEPLLVEAQPAAKSEKPSVVAGATVVFEQPQLPISTFSNCKYQREISVVGDMPITEGDWLAIKYNLTEPGYKYTLYFQPEGQGEWFIAPGTKELQGKPEFYLEMTKYHSGRYAVLAYSFQNRWGCLSTPLSEALRIKVER
ncbi:MAG: hypothetical protein SH848_15380 [Saprospiraceae bacterium]|nr:hypothetical protein [Saprospiraceae bacterium]MDZ4705306.1 hypothetical protein [Saprospiraceae bacterium]